VNNAIYLLVAAAVSAVGMLILWLRHRTPTSTMSSIDEFNETMRALSPDGPPARKRSVDYPAPEGDASTPTPSDPGPARPTRGTNRGH
jgi:hypothetical protein